MMITRTIGCKGSSFNVDVLSIGSGSRGMGNGKRDPTASAEYE